MGVKSRSKSNVTSFGLVLMMMALLMVACGGDEESKVAAVDQADSQASDTRSLGYVAEDLESEAIGDDVAIPEPTEKPEPPAVAVVPAEIAEPGSPEEGVLQGLTRQVRSLNHSDWQGFMDVCHPKFFHPPKMSQVKFAFEELGGDFGYFLPGFTVQGYNAREVVVTFPSEDVAVTKFDVYDYDNFVAAGVSRSWGLYDGVWYQDGGFMCTVDGVIKEEFVK